MTDFILKVIQILFFEEIFVFIPLVFLFCYFYFSIFFKRERSLFFQFLILLLPLVYIFYHYSYLQNFFSALGQDSILELDADLGESLFYIKTFFYFLFDPEIFKRKRFWLLLGSSLSFSLFIFSLIIFLTKKKNLNLIKTNSYFNYIFLLSSFLVIIFIINFFKINYDYGKELKNIEVNLRKVISNYETERGVEKNLKVITYIGESHSALNLSLYGYPFETTPWLEKQNKKGNFIKFSNVYSTHTHSTPSLIDAFSLCIKENEKDCLGYDNLKNKLPTLDILSKSNIKTNLYTSQGSLGGHNLSSKLVLNAKKIIIASDDVDEKLNRQNLLGNRFKTKIKDKEFFLNSYCKNEDLFLEKKSSLTLLHSYAGHGKFGGYLSYIPKGRIFKYPDYVNEKNLLGNDKKNFRLVNEYDTAINYSDETLSQVISCTFSNAKEKNAPVIFIYFSDHGESPATSRGHDSSRATYEMLHIPFLIFYNDQAKEKFRDELNFFEEIKNKNLTMNFLSEILIYLFDVNIKKSDSKKVIYSKGRFDSLSKDFILSRNQIDGKKTKLQTFFNYKGDLLKSEFDEKQFLRNDTSLNLWQLSNYLNSKGLTNKQNIENMVCRHRANSFIIQFQASLSTGCFETDIFFNSKKTLSTHDMKIDTNLKFDDFLKSSYQKNTVWIDGKNLNFVKNCFYGYKWLDKNSHKFESLLIEFPTPSIKNFDNIEWLNCVNKISNLEKVQVGYYLPTDTLLSCARKKISQIECNKKFFKILEFLKKTKIKSITFDHLGYGLVKNFKPFADFKWHIWHVNSLSSFNEIFKNKNIGIVLLRNDKFTNNLN